MEHNEALDRAQRDADYIGVATIWRNFIVQLNARTWNITEKMIAKLLADTQGFVSKIVSAAEKTDESCMKNAAHGRLAQQSSVYAAEDAAVIWKNFEAARADMQAHNVDNPQDYALTVMEPYLAAAVGDLIAFVFGQNEKAYFLTGISHNFSTHSNNTDFQSPGIINIYYQLTEAKFRDEGVWPLDDVVAEINRALVGADALVYRSRMRAKQSSVDQPIAEKIADSYNVVRFYLISRTLELYNQRALAGETVRFPPTGMGTST
jgi:hypothetical protein